MIPEIDANLIDTNLLAEKLKISIARVEQRCEEAAGAVEKYLRRMAVDDAKLALRWENRNLMLRAILNLNEYME